MSKGFDIKKLCDESLNELFSKEYFEKKIKRKELKNNSEPLYSDLDRRIAFIVHAVTIRSGIILEKIYFNQIKNCCSHLDVWSEEKFKISMDTDDIVDFSSYEKGKKILKKYKVVI